MTFSSTDARMIRASSTIRILALLISLSFHETLRADIAGYAIRTPVLDAEIHPRLVSAAPDGNVWFYQQTTIPYSIGFFTPSGHVTNFPIPCSQCSSGREVVYVFGLAAAPDGSVWFIDNHAASGTSIRSRVGNVTQAGQFTFFPIPTPHGTAIVPGLFGQSSITLAPNGHVWFTENAGSRAGQLVPSTGVITEYPLEMIEEPSGITVGTDGRVWFTVAPREIALITPPSNGEFVEFPLAAGAYPLGIATGPDGNIWITESGRDKIARLRPSGTISEFSVPTVNAVPQHIATAPDGTMWYTDSTGMDIGRITLRGSSDPTFEVLPTPGQENFDLTCTRSSQGAVIVYFTGRHLASGEDRLLMAAPVTIGGPRRRPTRP